jgi:4-hydroxy-tetrahydrodipicolinate synthase
MSRTLHSGSGRSQRLAGILPILQLPFDAAGDIIDADLAREVEFCIAGGCHGVVVPALASEFMVLTDDERRHAVEVSGRAAAGRIPVVAGVAAPSPRGAADLARHAEANGATAVMALPPYVRRPGPEGVIAYYRTIAEACSLPLIVQNAPPPFANGIGVELMLRLLQEVPAIRYVKEERPPAPHHITALLEAAPGRLDGIFGGAAGLYLMNELERGATGSMPSAAVADVQVSIFEDFVAGRRSAARERYNRILPLLNIEMSVMMAVSKEMLRRRGVFSQTGLRDPEFPLLDAGDIAEIDAIWPDISPLFTARAAPSAPAPAAGTT